MKRPIAVLDDVNRVIHRMPLMQRYRLWILEFPPYSSRLAPFPNIAVAGVSCHGLVTGLENRGAGE